MEARIAKYFYTDAASSTLLKKWLTSCSFLGLIATLVEHKKNIANEKKKYEVGMASRKELFKAMETYDDLTESLPSPSDYGSADATV